MEELKTTERICPECGKPYTGHSGLSRKDNKTEICGHCESVQAYMDMGHTREEAEEIQRYVEDGFDVTITDGHGILYSDNIKPLFTDEQLFDMAVDEARRFTRKDGAELMAAAIERAKVKHPEIEGDELIHEAFRLAYLRGYNRGMRFVSTLDLVYLMDDFKD